MSDAAIVTSPASSTAADISVPLLDLTAQYAPIRDEVLAAITRVCDSQRFILGPEVDALERELAEMIGVEHAITMSSGTDAILAALMALGIGPGDEVITPTFSFFATAGCVSRLGATPVFVDVDPVTLCIDPLAAENAMTSRTRAILPVHLFGLCADMTALSKMASAAGVTIIEDAAQAIGARIGDRQAGAFGHAACFSFFPSKNLGAFGDGGLVTTPDASMATELRLLRNHGAEPKYYHSRIGGNFRLDALQAAVLRVKAPHLRAWTDARRSNAERYRALFAEFDLGDTVELPIEPAGFTHIYNQFSVRVPNRDGLRTHLASRRIGTEVYYPVPFHRQACFADLERPGETFPIADRAAASSLALPVYGELTARQQRHVVASISEFYRPA